eukprot:7112937-Prymnesium_polylepis.1
MTLGHWSASQRLALLRNGHWSADRILPVPLCPAFVGLKSLGDGPKSCQRAVHKCFHAHKSFIASRDDQTDAFSPSRPSTFGPPTAVTARHWLALGTP